MASSQTAKTSNIDEDNEEEESWIPLSEEEEGNRKPPVVSSYGAEGNPSATTQNERIQAIQQRLETRLQLKKNLVNHPIELFWKRYLFNLAREFWGLEFYIQLGLSMILTGILLKIFLLSTWYIWYPKMAFLSVLFIVSLVYLDPFEIRIQINEIRKIIFSPDKAAEALEQLDMKQLRRLSLLLLMIPTALEVKTLSFLSQIKAESGWALYNTLLAFAILYLMMYLKRAKHLKPRECSYQGLLVLYGSALLVTIVKTDLGRMPVLAAPFFTATGTLLITYRDDDIEWFSRVLRHALRLTLRDVLSSVSEKVSQDEMLQLTILRWIADYWAYTPDNPASQTNDAPGGSRPKDTQSSQTPHSAPQPNTQSASSRPTPTQQTANDMGPRRRPNSLRFPRHEVQWEELLPMLNVAADHMASEVHILQSSNGTKNNPGIGNSNTENTTSSNRAGSPLSGGHDCDHEGLDNLKAMLMSLNVDEGARPAVMAYRRAVESFPPKKKTAVIISVLRRCPAMITLLWHCVFGSRSLFSSTMLILPFIFFEYYRIKEWISACEQITFFYGSGVERDESWGIPQELAEAEVMTILLCGDSPSIVRPPTLLLVWRNIVSSVSSLEIGLTTARCAQTTVVAVDFAGNMMSLMQFGFEVKEHGWLHGIATLTKEFISMNSADYNSTGQRRRGGETKYTNAAMGAVHNAQVVARNVQSLSEDENLQPVLQHVLGTLTVMCGYGWLWGNGESDSGKERTEVNSGAEDTTPDHGNSSTDEPSANDRTTREDTGKEQVDEPVAHEIPKTPGAKHASNELSEVMDMVAQAYEQGLINEVCYHVRKAILIMTVNQLTMSFSLLFFACRPRKMNSAKNCRACLIASFLTHL